MRSKYNVSKKKDDRTYDGIVFDSALEMKYYRDVVLPQFENNTIKFFERQKRYVLQPGYKKYGKSIQPIVYKADFYIEYANGRKEVIDIKGCPDATAKIKRKLFDYVFPDTTYIWVAYSAIDGGWKDYDYIQQARKIRKKNKLAQKEQKEDEKSIK